MPNRRRSLGGTALALILWLSLSAAGARSARWHAEGHFLATQSYEDRYYLPPPEWLRVLSLGHSEALAGLIWLKSLVYFGEELVHRGNVANLYRYADAMIALDPYFEKVYRWVASGAIYRTGTVTVDDEQRAIRYLEQGVRRFPDDGELAWDLGANYVYELVPMLATQAEKAEARRRGVEHLRVAALSGHGPPWLALSASTEFAKLGQAEQEMRYLEELYPQLSDPAMKLQVEARLARLRSRSYVEAVRRAGEEFEAAHVRDYPYLHPTLYLLLGPKPPFDGRALLLRGFDPEATRFEQE